MNFKGISSFYFSFCYLSCQPQVNLLFSKKGKLQAHYAKSVASLSLSFTLSVAECLMSFR